MKTGTKLNLTPEDRLRRSNHMKSPEFQAAAKAGRERRRLQDLADREERKRIAREKFYQECPKIRSKKTKA